MAETAVLCIVCTLPVTTEREAWCMECGKPYHLNQRQDVEAEECGMVWINEEHLALEFACHTCLNPLPPAANLDDILDLDEAAAAAGVTAEWLRGQAERGLVRHRKTGGGVFLFERRDVLALGR